MRLCLRHESCTIHTLSSDAFPHDEKIVTIDHISFVKPDHHMNPSHQPSLNFPHVLDS